ncbi:MAG TPA: hypothetical protein VKZ44_07735, partial [Taishania sp.]|nr:hypothetical protein [Taishania sp.]
DSRPNYNARLQLQLVDQFASDQYALDGKLIQDRDSIAIRQFFEALLSKDKDFKIIGRGNGIGKWNGTQVVRDTARTEINTYEPLGKDDISFKRLRLSEIFVNIDRDIIMEVNSYSDPIRSNFTIPNTAIESFKNQYKLSNNDILSAYRTVAILKKFKEEVSVLAGTFMTREEAKIIIDRFNREFNKIKISVGATSIKITEF